MPSGDCKIAFIQGHRNATGPVARGWLCQAGRRKVFCLGEY